MPRFSVIVPVYKVQAYLHECLDSVLRQSCTDFELIVVDDCSPDGSGAIIDEYAAADPRVRAIHLAENVGLGPARNAGMAQASGEYLIFLDSDDTLTPDALRAVSERLKETGGPDILLYDYARTFWTGETVRNAFAHLLNEEGPASFELAERPGLLKVIMVAWNKAYRREFIEQQQFTFPPGYYEDTPWTYPALMAAGSIGVLDRVCVHYRQRRRGSILGTTTRRHFDIFDQYERVFAFLDTRPDLESWRPVMFRRMTDHYATIFTKRGRLPRGTRGEFLRRARTHYRRYRAKGHPVSARTRVRHALVKFGTHRTYHVLRTLFRVGARLRRWAGAAKRLGRGALLQLHYRIQLRLPVKQDYAVFSAYWGRGHSCNPGAIEAKLRELAPGMRTAWIARREHHQHVPTGTRRLDYGTFAYWTALARAKYLVNNVNFDYRLRKRRGQIMIQTQHGTPLKHMGLDLMDHPAASRSMDFKRLMPNVDKWDYVLSANRHSTLVWERVFPASYEVLEYGYPRNDRFQHTNTEEVRRLRETLGIPEGSTAILYAPTHRDYRRTQRPPVDLERMLRELGPRFTVLTRAHHAYDTPLSTPDTAHARLVDVSDHPSIETLCLVSDALITDYSSLMFDYANLDRPIVIYADDWEAYEAARGTYFDLRAFPPGAVARNEDELTDIFATGHWRGSRSAQLRAAFRERFCPYDDGRAAERVVRHLFLGQTPGLPAVAPLAERRPVPGPAPRVGVPGPAEPTLVTPVPERP
ncbi:CDP-glycerol glycerophosphotransferase family protein [Streptomyces sp. NPDC050418]|uniref:bifunctional glycosyltransferase/CDP-glycerol:glycerophosphate glycerophosphotransferase n=1 Tax=Streptomyces sp. NPDC050418 TaxID=3365612 RepID=UPI0037AB5CC8